LVTSDNLAQENVREHRRSRHSGEAFSTVAHLPKLGHIGQTVNARAFTYATCCALHTLIARQGKGRGFGTGYCCPTAAKSLVFALRVLGFLQDLQEKQRADERTRTAYPCSSYEFAAVHASLS
jgi:hypothetical protein